MPCPNPLTPEQCAILTEVIQYLHDTRELLQKLTDIGVHLPDKLENNAAQMDLAVKLKRGFFPGNN